MSLNFELKARIPDLDKLENYLAGKADRHESLNQTDTYFKVNRGRFKLRQSPQLGDELIYYLRPSQTDVKDSRYWRQPLTNGEVQLRLLSEACGIDTVVKKAREVYFIENVRIHLDRVESLGEFLEFEAVITEQDQVKRSRQLVDQLTNELQLAPSQYVAESYRELMLRTDSPASPSP